MENNNIKKIRNIELAISDLKRGYPIRLYNNDNARVIVLSVESLFVTGWQFFHDNDYSTVKNVIISNVRAKHIFNTDSLDTDFNRNISIDCKNMSLNEIEKISAVSGDVDKKYNDKYKINVANNIESDSLIITKIAELLPAIVIIETNNQYDCIEVNTKDLASYQDIISERIEKIASSKLILKDVESSSIEVFRTFPSSKEHYAIIIGDIYNIDAPIVRIHSSCYTGDLLASLECDCRDQLHEAISVMNKEGAGILLYLIQEGRGIGLANKIRAYNLKNKGYDTIDANEILGFDDDERPYKLAAEMLKKLDINEIRLLTNNPRKITAMEENGIKVADVVSHIMEENEHNKSYLEAKFSKLGHIIAKKEVL